MSDLLLTSIAQAEAEKAVEEMIKDYNDPNLTPKGKKEVLTNAFFFNYIQGYRFCEERTKSANYAKEMNKEFGNG